MSNPTWNNDPKPEGSGDDNAAGGYTPPSSDAGEGQTPGYQPPSWDGDQQAPSGTSGSDAPQQSGYQPPNWDAGQQAPSGTSGSDAPQQSGYNPPTYGAPSTPDQSFGQTPSYGAPDQGQFGQQAGGYGQAPSAQTPYGAAPQQGGYDPNAGGGYGQPPTAPSPYGAAPQGGYDPNSAAGSYGQPPAPYGAPGGSYGAPTPYGAPGGYQPNPYAQAGPQLAVWGRRALGGLVDFAGPAIVISILISILMPNGGFGANLLSTVLTLGWWAYNSGYRVATTGYSFGHKIGKVRVVMEDTGQTPTQNVAITRALAHFLDSICLVGFLFPLWDPKKQTFADKIAKTVVIDEQNAQR